MILILKKVVGITIFYSKIIISITTYIYLLNINLKFTPNDKLKKKYTPL